MLSKEDIKRALPANMKTAATQELADKVNNISSDPIIAKEIRDNFISYASVIKEGRFNTTDYLNAVAYVSYKLMGLTNREAYIKVFPQRYTDLVARGLDESAIASYVSSYNKGKLVNLILEQTLVPTWVLNQDLYQKALNVQAHLMMHAQSDKVKSDAANSILTHLKKPETKDFQLSINMQDNSGMNELKDTLADLADQQRRLIESGASAKDIAAAKLSENKVIEGKVV